MEYHFNTEDAKKYGVDEAIMLYNFKFWIKKNKANKKHQHECEIEGKKSRRYWTYNSQEAFIEQFPFWNRNQIRRILKSLIDQKTIITGNFNTTGFDRTTWYALYDEENSIGENPPMEDEKSTNGLGGKNQPIPDTKPDTKPKKKEDEISSSYLLAVFLKEMNQRYELKLTQNKGTRKLFKELREKHLIDKWPYFDYVANREDQESHFIRALLDDLYFSDWQAAEKSERKRTDQKIEDRLPRTPEEEAESQKYIDEMKRIGKKKVG